MKTCSLAAGGVAFLVPTLAVLHYHPDRSSNPATPGPVAPPRTSGGPTGGSQNVSTDVYLGAVGILALGAAALYALGRKDCALGVGVGAAAAAVALPTGLPYYMALMIGGVEEKLFGPARSLFAPPPKKLA